MHFRHWLAPLVLLVTLAGCTSKEQQKPALAAPDEKATTTAQPNPPAPESSAPTAAPASSASANTNPSVPIKKPEPIVLPVGTVFNVYLANEVGTKISKTGDEFTGTLASPLAVEKKVLISTGADVSGTVSQAKAAGKFKGGAVLALELRSVTVNGKRYPLRTQMVAQTSTGKGKRTTGMVVGGTGGGALIGGLAGGGKGAAIGAAVGAAAGIAGAGLTGNRDIKLPVESIVSFKLLDPLELDPVATKNRE